MRMLVAMTSLGLCGFVCLPVGSQGVGVFTFDFARVLFRAHVDKPGSRPTSTKEPHVVQPVLSRPLLASSPPHVGHRRETGLTPLARTCSWTWSFPWRLHDSAHPFLVFTAVHNTKLNSKNGDSSSCGRPDSSTA